MAGIGGGGGGGGGARWQARPKWNFVEVVGSINDGKMLDSFMNSFQLLMETCSAFHHWGIEGGGKGAGEDGRGRSQFQSHFKPITLPPPPAFTPSSTDDVEIELNLIEMI